MDPTLEAGSSNQSLPPRVAEGGRQSQGQDGGEHLVLKAQEHRHSEKANLGKCPLIMSLKLGVEGVAFKSGMHKEMNLPSTCRGEMQGPRTWAQPRGDTEGPKI